MSLPRRCVVELGSFAVLDTTFIMVSLCRAMHCTMYYLISSVTCQIQQQRIIQKIHSKTLSSEITRLSAVTVSYCDWKLCFRFLFGFIQKDRLCESLVEKLCHRFRAARSLEQDHDLAYCLTLLPVTDKTLRKLQENVSCYQDKLVNDKVYSAFTTIIGKLKKLSKPDLKVSNPPIF